MNKKSLLSILLISVLCVVNVYSDVGVGGEIGFEAGPYYNNFFSGTIRSDKTPWTLSVNSSFFDGNIGATADNWFVYKTVSDPVNYYVFWGISAGLEFDDFGLNTGARIGIGLDWFILDSKELELYCQAAWNPYLGIKHEDDWDFVFRPLCFPFSTGARWWFR